jgi:hypothetical protein
MGETQELQDARRRFTRLAQDMPGSGSMSRTSNLPLSAEELLRDAQERHHIFFHPVVVKAFGIAEKAHRGQVCPYASLYIL